MVKPVRAPTASAFVHVPNAHIRGPTTAYYSSSRGSSALFWLCRLLHAHTYTHTHTHKHTQQLKAKIKFLLKKQKSIRVHSDHRYSGPSLFHEELALSKTDSMGVAGRKDMSICSSAGKGTYREPWVEGSWYLISRARESFLKVDWRPETWGASSHVGEAALERT